ncbi:glycosyltransferase [uncultured Paracoccus sp.]|uniref:glycosyltransferase n=1 Tax=uncultured Paracoccus sp. TaxID=189685 RepID=UPI002606C3BB|nr:glycosyltransferase [uncultured Paracoccus sp.]
MRVQMLGLCRFSHLGAPAFQQEHATLQERRAFLYDPARLARRWFWFENVALPGLLAQTDPDFTLVVMTGPDLPQPYLDDLRELTRLVPQLRLELVGPRDTHLQACMAAIRPHVDPAADVVGHFRHDDDDAISTDYIAAARADFRFARPLFRQAGRVSVDYCRGFVLRADGTGVRARPQVIHNASAALTIYLQPDVDRCAIHFPHWQLALSMPGLVLADQPRFVRVLHHDNDSGAIGAGYPWMLPQDQVSEMLANRFRLHLPTIDQGVRRFGEPPAG